MGKFDPKNRNIDFYQAILKLKDLDECMNFFEDVCAMNELQSIEQRFEVARLLRAEKVYKEITERTKASTATISRVNRMLNYGTGCLGRILDEMKEEQGPEASEE